MKYVLVSDGHLTSSQPPGRLDNALDTCVRKLRWILQFCHDNNAHLLQAGDFFDNDRDWYILAEAAQAFYEYAGTVRVYTVPGQHDKYYRTKQKATNLGVLEKAGLVTVLTPQPTYTTEIENLLPSDTNTTRGVFNTVVALYGFGWGDQFCNPISEPAPAFNIMVAHAPIAPAGVYPGHQIIEPGRLARRGYDTVLCGDVHRQFHITKPGCDIVNTGPIYRYKAEEYNFTHKPSVALWHDGVINWHEIPHDLADVVLSRAHITNPTENRLNMAEFTAKLRGRPAESRASLRDRVYSKIKQGGYDPETLKILREVMGQDANGLISY